MVRDHSSVPPLVLGFYGEQDVHSANSRALLEDLISVHRKTYGKQSEIIFLIPTEPATSTLTDLAEWCFSSGWVLELIGRHETFADEEVQQLLEVTATKREVPSSMSIARGLVKVLAQRPNPHLFLLSDANTDDDAHEALAAAHEFSVPVRSLLKGLEKVVYIEDEEMELEEEVTDEEEWVDDEEETEAEDEELVESDDEYEDSGEDEDEEPEEEAEEEEEAGDDDEESWVDAEDDEDGELIDEEEEDEPEEGEYEEESEEVAEPPERKKSMGSTGTPMTEKSLLRLAERDREEFLELAAEYEVYPGRGMKNLTMVRRILDANGSNGVAPKKATVKRVAAKKKAVSKKPAVKKVAPKPQAAKPAPKRAVAPKVAPQRRVSDPLDAIKITLEAAQNALQGADAALSAARTAFRLLSK